MAKRTFLQLVQIVKEECGISGETVPSVVNQIGRYADIVRWTADAAYEIENLHGDWDFLWSPFASTTIVNVSNYSAPDDIGLWDTESFVLDQGTANYTGLVFVDHRELRKMTRGLSVQNTPHQVAILPDRSLQLYPTPNKVHTIDGFYWRIPDRMTVNDDTSYIPEEFEWTIIARAKMKYGEEQGSMVILANSEAEYGEWLDKLERSQLPSKKRQRYSESSNFVVIPE